MNARRASVLTPYGQRVLTIIIAFLAALITVLAMHACDGDFYGGRPSDAYPSLP